MALSFAGPPDPSMKYGVKETFPSNNPLFKVGSSIGRAVVSKTEGCRFKSYLTCFSRGGCHGVSSAPRRGGRPHNKPARLRCSPPQVKAKSSSGDNANEIYAAHQVKPWRGPRVKDPRWQRRRWHGLRRVRSLLNYLKPSPRGLELRRHP